MARYRKKPVVIEAVQFDGSNYDEICDWIDSCTGEFTPAVARGSELVIGTLEGDMHASPGDWIIRGVQGEFYPCKPDIFQATYERADQPPQPKQYATLDDLAAAVQADD